MTSDLVYRVLRGVEQGNQRADSDEETGIKSPRYLLKRSRKMESSPGEARAGCRKPGAENEAGARGVETG